MRYVRFVLSDLPLELRLKAARLVADGVVNELRRDCLDGHVSTGVRAWACLEAVWAMDAAQHPPDRREYLVPRDDWEAIVGP